MNDEIIPDKLLQEYAIWRQELTEEALEAIREDKDWKIVVTSRGLPLEDQDKEDQN